MHGIPAAAVRAVHSNTGVLTGHPNQFGVLFSFNRSVILYNLVFGNKSSVLYPVPLPSNERR